jgi:hypothetical protein
VILAALSGPLDLAHVHVVLAVPHDNVDDVVVVALEELAAWRL